MAAESHPSRWLSNPLHRVSRALLLHAMRPASLDESGPAVDNQRRTAIDQPAFARRRSSGEAKQR